MDRLKDKVAIITGASQGMGASHAKLFVSEGAKVAITDINEEKGNQVAAELGNGTIFIKQDVSSESDWQNVVHTTVDHFGKLDILVNNAGISINKSLDDMSVDDYLKIFKINQLSVFLGTKYAAPALRKNGSGSIVNISSMNGLVGGAVGYTDTKFAVRGLTKAVALQLAKDNIRVNSVHPGVIATPMILQGDSKAVIEEFAKNIPLQRVAEPSEVSKTVLFLASDDSSYSTGSEFIIDGGLTAQ
ncbi:glucose 1-dehydrogenase [Lentilactobacillus parafarraginis]|uniref:Cyclopentanol dehydrogenase n=2 Tax=Lentilactobacillus parafarraginis TaxID=390842 RepID=A0A0R1YQX3_9LACO|nr:glucose 1-dehydrogenase [Lentilactobacillus parafarraginis]KRM44527.1 cyclopentanol dehydrogenase [Lentilactobacillus parafarraginis DSM 18390 = JCM 14109]TLQ19643.1 glucose 1-dehydrogenase [Lentilactobacillus parafarraginis]